MFAVVVHLFACIEYALSDASSLLAGCGGDGSLDAPQCWPYRAGILPPATLNETSRELSLPPSRLDGFTLYLAAFFHTASQACHTLPHSSTLSHTLPHCITSAPPIHAGIGAVRRAVHTGRRAARTHLPAHAHFLQHLPSVGRC